MDAKVSVIVPVHNTEAYLRACLNSILVQRLDSIEVLCVDDRSADRSPSILEEYSRQDSRIKLVPQKPDKYGPGAARNTALERARGEYVAFVDSDDVIHGNMLRRMHSTAMDQDADIVMCKISRFSAGSDRGRYASCTFDRLIPSALDGCAFSWLDIQDVLFGLRFVAWNKIYRRDFLVERGLRFSEGIFYEDLRFSYQALLLAERIRFVRKPLYYNRKEREGATTFARGSRVYDAIAAMKELDRFLRSNTGYEPLYQQFEAFRYNKLYEYVHKNDSDNLPRFFAQLAEYARSSSLDENPYVRRTAGRAREHVQRGDLLGFLTYEIREVRTRNKVLENGIRRLEHVLRPWAAMTGPAVSTVRALRAFAWTGSQRALVLSRSLTDHRERPQVSENDIRASVIVPVFNTENYLRDCLDSILSQRFRGLEVLCVDDGSTDSSVEILKEYADRDPRLRMVSQRPGGRGPGTARNAALDAARGDYVAFVDSDDLIRKDMIASMLDLAEAHDLDMVACTIEKFSDTSKRELFAPCTFDQLIPSQLDSTTFSWTDLQDVVFGLRFSSCNKIYKRSFLAKWDIRFSEGTFYEDLCFSYRALLLADGIRFIRKPLYFNRRQRRGATTFESGSRVYDALAAMKQLDTFLSSRPEFAVLRDRFEAFRFEKLYEYLHKNDSEHLPSYFAELKRYASVPSLGHNPHLRESVAQKRALIEEKDLLSFLAIELWEARTKNARLARQKRQLARQLYPLIWLRGKAKGVVKRFRGWRSGASAT